MIYTITSFIPKRTEFLDIVAKILKFYTTDDISADTTAYIATVQSIIKTTVEGGAYDETTMGTTLDSIVGVHGNGVLASFKSWLHAGMNIIAIYNAVPSLDNATDVAIVTDVVADMDILLTKITLKFKYGVYAAPTSATDLTTAYWTVLAIDMKYAFDKITVDPITGYIDFVDAAQSDASEFAIVMLQVDIGNSVRTVVDYVTTMNKISDNAVSLYIYPIEV